MFVIYLHKINIIFTSLREVHICAVNCVILQNVQIYKFLLIIKFVICILQILRTQLYEGIPS